MCTLFAVTGAVRFLAQIMYVLRGSVPDLRQCISYTSQQSVMSNIHVHVYNLAVRKCTYTSLQTPIQVSKM